MDYLYLNRAYGSIASTYRTATQVLNIIKDRKKISNSGGAELIMMCLLSMLEPKVKGPMPNLRDSSPQALDERIYSSDLQNVK